MRTFHPSGHELDGRDLARPPRRTARRGSVPGKRKGGPLAQPASVQPFAYLHLRPNIAEQGIELATEKQKCRNSKNRDQSENECIFRETLAFLAAKEWEQERTPFSRTARRSRSGWVNSDRSDDFGGRRCMNAQSKPTHDGPCWVGLPSFSDWADRPFPPIVAPGWPG